MHELDLPDRIVRCHPKKRPYEMMMTFGFLRKDPLDLYLDFLRLLRQSYLLRQLRLPWDANAGIARLQRWEFDR